jgi:hypothetical protein
MSFPQRGGVVASRLENPTIRMVNCEQSKQMSLDYRDLQCLLAGGGAALAATSGTHYGFGGEGVMAGTTPPVGFTYRMYNTWSNPTTMKDNRGHKINNGFNLDIFASAHRFVYVTESKLFGADYFYDVVMPLVSKDLDIKATGFSDSKSLSLGDMVIEPLALGWHKPRWDGAFGLAVIAPTGEYDADVPTSPGLGYWSGMLTIGGTYYFDAARTWTISALTRTIINSRQRDTHVRPGSEFVMEYGLGKEVQMRDDLLVRVGIAGAIYRQFSDDSKDGVDTIASEHKQSNALGGELNLFYLPAQFQANIRVLREFDAENTTQGSQAVLTLTKSF